MQAMYNYERIILNAFTEVSNEHSDLSNLDSMYSLKTKEVDTLIKNIDISNDLFKSARDDCLEVLLTQRDVLTSRLELIETKKR
jgi:outer membrane protein, multidrug efflux system